MYTVHSTYYIYNQEKSNYKGVMLEEVDYFRIKDGQLMSTDCSTLHFNTDVL